MIEGRAWIARSTCTNVAVGGFSLDAALRRDEHLPNLVVQLQLIRQQSQHTLVVPACQRIIDLAKLYPCLCELNLTKHVIHVERIVTLQCIRRRWTEVSGECL